MQRKIVVFASGDGSNFQNIVEKSKDNNYQVTLLFCDRKKAKVIKRANSLSIPFKYLSIIKEKNRFSEKVLEILEKEQPNLIVLAGYMKLLDKTIIKT
jgi:phosphoribosylglycinamide formyltransferase-1